VLDILGGLRSACAYVGAAHLRLRELPKRRTTFIRVTAQLNEAFRAHTDSDSATRAPSPEEGPGPPPLQRAQGPPPLAREQASLHPKPRSEGGWVAPAPGG
jgi:hypothetical protein